MVLLFFVKHIGKATIGNMYICLKIIWLVARVHGGYRMCKG